VVSESAPVQWFCRAHEHEHQTDRRTDHATPSVAVARILYNAQVWSVSHHITLSSC